MLQVGYDSVERLRLLQSAKHATRLSQSSSHRIRMTKHSSQLRDHSCVKVKGDHATQRTIALRWTFPVTGAALGQGTARADVKLCERDTGLWTRTKRDKDKSRAQCSACVFPSTPLTAGRNAGCKGLGDSNADSSAADCRSWSPSRTIASTARPRGN